MCSRIARLPLYFITNKDDQLESVLWCQDHIANKTRRGLRRKRKHKEWRPSALNTRQSQNSDWHFTETLSVYPKNKVYLSREKHCLFDQTPENEGDLNKWTIVSTTDMRSKEAFEAHRLIAEQWEETIVGGLEPVIERFFCFKNCELF
ncbi:hypothetical protein MHBO_005197 [Bonamia ostreae]|uniref:Uncharacterized protein n=1 Tax=Bonamia ostreae TaxID=126728 RepID=A0ABV2AVA4_9EUKA